ncbi:MAG TPA: circularly permuted type 2 ATP-grasp protein [Sphingomonas sp.]
MNVTATRRRDRDRELLDAWLGDYARAATPGDMFAGAPAETAATWRAMLARLAALSHGRPAALAETVARQVVDLGMAFRLTGEEDERPWPLNAVPMLIGAGEWATIERGLAQRAELLERVLADIYGPQTLVRSGKLPAAAVTGSANFWRNMVGMRPPAGRHLHFYSADLGRGPNGEWRVLSDRVRTPIGLGYALENRLAFSRATGDLLGRMNVRRLASFFADLRQGLARDCKRSDPRIGLLTPGRFNQSYAEQAHLARYLGFLLVEGEDLVVTDGLPYVRTIEGLKRIDGLWRWMDSRFLDPLAFDGRSRIGVPDLFEAMATGAFVLSNWPGAGVVESRAFSAFLPRLASAVLGEDLVLPNIATWWCGQAAEHDAVVERLDDMVIGSAFDRRVPGIGEALSLPAASLSPESRAELVAAMRLRPMDYVGQEVVRLSTTPALVGGVLAPHPFTLRVFVARDGDGRWTIMPGAFARLAAHGDIRAALMGKGDMSADVCVVETRPEPEERGVAPAAPQIRRAGGMLPSKAADNLFWLGRYIERAEITLRMIRAVLGGSIEVDSGPALALRTMHHLVDLLVRWGAVPRDRRHAPIAELCLTALGDPGQPGSARALLDAVGGIGKGLRDRLAVDFWRLVRQPFPAIEDAGTEAMIEASTMLINRIAALSGLAAENMGRTDGWRFHDLGRRMERAINTCQVVERFAGDEASSDDLTILLDLCDCQITYRTRYLARPSVLAVRDMVVLETQNPRAIAYQVSLIAEHLRLLPSLRNDGMPEQPVQLAGALVAMLAPMTGETMGHAVLDNLETRLMTLSDAISQRYFLQNRRAEKTAAADLLA